MLDKSAYDSIYIYGVHSHKFCSLELYVNFCINILCTYRIITLKETLFPEWKYNPNAFCLRTYVSYANAAIKNFKISFMTLMQLKDIFSMEDLIQIH